MTPTVVTRNALRANDCDTSDDASRDHAAREFGINDLPSPADFERCGRMPTARTGMWPGSGIARAPIAASTLALAWLAALQRHARAPSLEQSWEVRAGGAQRTLVTAPPSREGEENQHKRQLCVEGDALLLRPRTT